MSEEIGFANSVKIKSAGKNEDWLQGKIYEAPTCLGLGELVGVERERRQASGGFLDIFLKDSDDTTRYEVEVQLGATDSSHIIRMIEYWDNEKRRLPQLDHVAVLVAEEINSRFFNVVHLLGHYIPVIAIQVRLIEINGNHTLFFTKVLDTSEEIKYNEENSETIRVTPTREYWEGKAKWTLDTADCLKELLSGTVTGLDIEYKQQYLWLSTPRDRYFRFFKRGRNKTLLVILTEEETLEATKNLLEENNISYDDRRFGDTGMEIEIDDQSFVEKYKDVFVKLAKMRSES